MTFLVNAAKYYNAEPHQKAAWDALEVALDASTLEAFKAAYRECFSSSCAMLAGYKGKVKSDDQYNLIRQGQGQHPAHCNLIARCAHKDVL